MQTPFAVSARPLRAVIAIVALALAWALAAPQGASAAARIIELGKIADPPAVSCPDNCQAVGRVSGYQLRAGSKTSPHRAGRRGKIVAFSVTLGDPRKDQIDFFDDLFGGPAQVQISILRRGSRNRHRLTGQSPAFDVTDYFGSTPTFVLPRPLTVKRGYVVALTTKTWVPAFAVNQPESDVWRSSRARSSCDDVRQSAAQTSRGSLRTYGCIYRTAQLLYTAVMVPDPRRTSRRSSARSSRSADAADRRRGDDPRTGGVFAW